VSPSGSLVVVDNYDSFTFNLVQLLRTIVRREGGPDDTVTVVRNDAETADSLLRRGPAAVLLSPGPGLPSEAGLCLALVRSAPASLPIFGVCLGMQILAEAFGARVVRARRTMHGRTSELRHDGCGAFAAVPSPARVMRYHSWVVEEASLPFAIAPSAWADDGTLMAFRHLSRPIEAVQFHPESFLTEHGDAMLLPFVRSALSLALPRSERVHRT
jgi:anthranilate synthase component 2